jgi:shikimate dehydrogenase
VEISGRTKVLGVLGHPVGHSRSPIMHNEAIKALGLDYVYVPLDAEPDRLKQALDGIRALGIAGVNVTIPHKEAVISFLDEVDDCAREIGSVNTIKNVDGKLIGASTDGPGFMRSLSELDFSCEGRNTVVIGAGGSGRAITFALAKAGADVAVLSRTPEKAVDLAKDVNMPNVRALRTQNSELEAILAEVDLLVNCTPVGMQNGSNGGIPIPLHALQPGALVYDLVYNPPRTKLLVAAEAAGALVVNGVKMLVYQGALSFEMWTGIEPPVDVMEDAVLESLR